ncbi:NADP-dependent 3-hydroxy acid dehydrogenase YdfG [Lysinibacillus sp. RC79]
MFKDLVVVVTGGAQGIGKGIVLVYEMVPMLLSPIKIKN